MIQGGYGSLLERLSGTSRSRSSLPTADAVSTSVMAQLARMLSTRAGSVQMLPDYGLPELNDMRLTLHDTRQQARAAIERSISRYEPRLRDVRVACRHDANDPLRLSFTISAKLNLPALQQPVTFNLQLDGQGQAAVTVLHDSAGAGG
ncbi:MAG: type VI secretion system baseplate subunit TssE [Pseudomonadaceae bacterium]